MEMKARDKDNGVVISDGHPNTWHDPLSDKQTGPYQSQLSGLSVFLSFSVKQISYIQPNSVLTEKRIFLHNLWL